MSAKGGDKTEFASRHPNQLCHRIQSDSQTNSVHIKGLFCAGDRLKHFIDLNEFHMLYLTVPSDRLDRVADVEWHASSTDFTCMYAVSANIGCCLNQRNDICSCLHQLIRDNQPHISRSKHQDSLPRQYSIDIYHCLCSTSPHHTGQSTSGKGEIILFCSRCDNDLFCFNSPVLIIVNHT